MINLRKLPHKFKKFAEAEPEDVQIAKEANGASFITRVQRYRIPNLLEVQMEKINRAWRYYSTKFTKSPRVNDLIAKLSTSGNIRASKGLQVLVDIDEQMAGYMKARDLDGMILTTRTMYAMLKYVGYKRGPHKDDEYTDFDATTQATVLLRRYGLAAAAQMVGSNPSLSTI